MKTRWELKMLGEVCEFDKSQAMHENLAYVGLEDIESNTASFLGSFESQSVKSSTFKFSTNHVLYGRLRPYLNKVLAPEFEGHCSTEIFPIKPNASLLREYLVYWFLREQTVELINATCTGARMPRADMNAVLNFEFLLPSTQEQQRIVAILDQAFEGIAKARASAEQNLQNARALFESHLQSVFTQTGEGWIEASLEDCIRLKSGDGLTCSMMKTDGNYSVFGGNGIAGKFDKFNLSGSNVIIGRVGALCGNVRHIEESIWLTDNAFRVSDYKYNFDHSFLTYLLNYKNLRGFARQAAQPVISNSSLKDVKLNFPNSVIEQSRIVSDLNSLKKETQRLESLYQSKIACLDELKKSLLQQAFAGKL